MHDTMAMLQYERGYLAAGKKLIAGMDEVGRGPLAGPVTVACVVMPTEERNIISGVDDSKKLSEATRERLYEKIVARALFMSVEQLDEKVIDEINILNATKLCMRSAVAHLGVRPDVLLVDAVRDDFGVPYEAIVKGDALSYSIACASIVAKVTRDRLMREYDAVYPPYGFASNKGYGTKAHIEALLLHGPCPIHRNSFIKNFVGDVAAEKA